MKVSIHGVLLVTTAVPHVVEKAAPLLTAEVSEPQIWEIQATYAVFICRLSNVKVEPVNVVSIIVVVPDMRYCRR